MQRGCFQPPVLQLGTREETFESSSDSVVMRPLGLPQIRKRVETRCGDGDGEGTGFSDLQPESSLPASLGESRGGEDQLRGPR